MEGERYKKSPEIVKEFMKMRPAFTAPASYAVFKRWDRLEPGDEPEVVVLCAPPDVLSGLFTLAGFEESRPEASLHRLARVARPSFNILISRESENARGPSWACSMSRRGPGCPVKPSRSPFPWASSRAWWKTWTRASSSPPRGNASRIACDARLRPAKVPSPGFSCLPGKRFRTGTRNRAAYGAWNRSPFYRGSFKLCGLRPLRPCSCLGSSPRADAAWTSEADAIRAGTTCGCTGSARITGQRRY